MPVITGAERPTENFHHRRHTLNANRSALESLGVGVQNLLEWGVARVSRHGEPHIYDTRLFPWAAEIEREWPSSARNWMP